VGETMPTYFFSNDCVQIFYQAGTIQYIDQSGAVETKTYNIGDAHFIPAGAIHAEHAVSGNPSAITIELK